MAARKSPRDSVCPHCKRRFTKGGLKQHMRYVRCSPTSTASPRKFDRVCCKHCGKSFHSTNSLRVHVSTVHAKEYAKSPGHMKDHRSPYHGKKRSGGASGRTSHRGGSPHASAQRSPSPRDHAGDHADPSRGSTHRPPSRKRSGHRHQTERDTWQIVDTRGPPPEAPEPLWQREMSKKLVEAARRK